MPTGRRIASAFPQTPCHQEPPAASASPGFFSLRLGHRPPRTPTANYGRHYRADTTARDRPAPYRPTALGRVTPPAGVAAAPRAGVAAALRAGVAAGADSSALVDGLKGQRRSCPEPNRLNIPVPSAGGGVR